MREGSPFRREWMADDAPRMILLQLDGGVPPGDPYQVNSDNHGPYGDAITRELIPHVESKFRGIGTGQSRVVDGGSTGGWVSLLPTGLLSRLLQRLLVVVAPTAWISAHFQLVNVYDDVNAFVNADGFERPACRTPSGDVKYTMRHEVSMENLLGRGDSWASSAAQWGRWNATYGPRGKDGKPVPLWDPKTGKIDRSVVDHWERYDLRMVLEKNWSTLGPRLRGKIHVYVGESDDYFLNNAVHRLDAFLSHCSPPSDAVVRFGPGQGHCWCEIDESEMMRQMAARMSR